MSAVAHPAHLPLAGRGHGPALGGGQRLLTATPSSVGITTLGGEEFRERLRLAGANSAVHNDWPPPILRVIVPAVRRRRFFKGHFLGRIRYTQLRLHMVRENLVLQAESRRLPSIRVELGPVGRSRTRQTGKGTGSGAGCTNFWQATLSALGGLYSHLGLSRFSLLCVWPSRNHLRDPGPNFGQGWIFSRYVQVGFGGGFDKPATSVAWL